jgi:hypothetical protein
MTDLVVRATIAAATIAWAAAEWWRLTRPHVPDAPARALWTIGAASMTAHAVAAFHTVYGWSHHRALVETARQTAAVTGWTWGGGLFVNYAFVAIWMADAAWWWLAPDAYRRRPAALSAALRGVFLFMFLNGAIIFAAGAMRVLGIIAVSVVTAAWYRSATTRRHA